MSENCVDEQTPTWQDEALAAINDIRKHVTFADIANNLPNTNQKVFINLKTLENKDFCIEMTASGFRVIGSSFDDTSLMAADGINYETPYALLNTVSQKYRESFGGELMNKLLDLAKKTDS